MLYTSKYPKVYHKHFEKSQKPGGPPPPGFLKNDAHFEGILILVSQCTCK